MPSPANSQNHSPNASDILIAGDGIAAKAAAIALRKHRPDLSVTFCGHGEVQASIGETLPPGIRPYLKALDLWPSFLAQQHAPTYQSISCWNSTTPRDNPFMLNQEGHGWHLDRPKFDQLLLNKALELGANHQHGWLQQAKYDGTHWQARIGKRPTQARYLIDATGRNAKVARQLGAKLQHHDQLLAIIHSYRNIEQQQVSSLIEACANGWWYSAGIPNNRSICAFMTDTHNSQAIQLLHRQTDWQQALQQAPLTRQRLQGARPEPNCLRRSANSQSLNAPAGPWWAAIGDAAQAYDPLSSDGIRKALHDGLGISVMVEAWLDDGAESGQPLMERYCRAQTRSFKQYLQTRQAFYREENRWPQAAFWATQQGM